VLSVVRARTLGQNQVATTCTQQRHLKTHLFPDPIVRDYVQDYRREVCATVSSRKLDKVEEVAACNIVLIHIVDIDGNERKSVLCRPLVIADGEA
jgi:hypothetical protein